MTTEQDDSLKVTPEDQDWLRAEVAGLTFGRLLKSHRECEELSAKEVADRLGISVQALSAYETGRKIPSSKKAFEIAKALGMMPELAAVTAINDQLHRDELPLTVAVVG